MKSRCSPNARTSVKPIRGSSAHTRWSAPAVTMSPPPMPSPPSARALRSAASPQLPPPPPPSWAGACVWAGGVAAVAVVVVVVVVAGRVARRASRAARPHEEQRRAGAGCSALQQRGPACRGCVLARRVSRRVRPVRTPHGADPAKHRGGGTSPASPARRGASFGSALDRVPGKRQQATCPLNPYAPKLDAHSGTSLPPCFRIGR